MDHIDDENAFSSHPYRSLSDSFYFLEFAEVIHLNGLREILMYLKNGCLRYETYFVSSWLGWLPCVDAHGTTFVLSYQPYRVWK